MMALVRRIVLGLVALCLASGIGIILVQSFWISYGVFMRYVIRQPDGTVTEATALLLVPLAFLGLPYALKKDAFPRVTFLTDRLPVRFANLLGQFNLAIEIFVGFFFGAVAVNATLTSFQSGASSSVLGWPEYIFWAPMAFAYVVFVVYALYRLVSADGHARASGQ